MAFNVNVAIGKFIAKITTYIIDIIYFVLEKLTQINYSYIEIENPRIIYVVIYYLVAFTYMIYKEIKVVKEQENELQGYRVGNKGENV